jgi:hypothetical protein
VGALARQVQGKERSDRLDIADEWDALAEQNDALENSELAAHAELTTKKNDRLVGAARPAFRNPATTAFARIARASFYRSATPDWR